MTDLLFGYLSKSELLECSLISKKWISPCRQFLHRHHECLLLLDARKQEHAPADLLKSVLVTSKLLDDCDEIFYNGVFWNSSIKYKRRRLTTNSNRNLKRTFVVIDSILKRLPKIKFLTLDTVGWNDMGYISLVRRYPIDLTEIEKLEIFDRITPRIYDAFFGEKVFPSLKTAYIPWNHVYFGEQAHYTILQRLLSSSPVLQEWPSYVRQSDIKYFAEANKLATIKILSIKTGIDPDLVDQIEAANVVLRGLDCKIDPTTGNVEIFRRITSLSTASLMVIKLGYLFCKMLVTTPGIRPFINVKKLALTNWEYVGSFKGMQAEMEANSNVQRLFPNANLVPWPPLDWMI